MDGAASEVAVLGPDEMEVGRQAAFDHRLTDDDLDHFAALTGDVSPLHMDAGFARSRGFRGRVAHGTLLAGFVSRLFGVHMPGRDCILHSITMKWAQPACVGDALRFAATIAQSSPQLGAFVAEVKVVNADTHEVVATGKVQGGFTKVVP